MFDIGFWELVIIVIVTLLVIGPEQLPAFARKAGQWTAQIKRLTNNLQREFRQQLKFDEQTSFNHQLDDLDQLMKNAPDHNRPTSKTNHKDTNDDKI